ncbi:MAG: hypothetical protein KME16_21945 [Scytolyngbya sp. HA4215-MV1]|jgi:hypothetical protein|nr:hypothetical protein [Scytolyngbya sp. HA4215-MV1]
MSETLELFIDLNAAGLGLEPDDLETYSQRLVADLKEGLADDAKLVRSTEVPEGGKSGLAGFDVGFLKAEVDLKKVQAVLGWLKNRMVGVTLRIEYGDVKLEYQTPEQLEQQLQALEKISHLTVRVVKSDASKG